MKNLAIKAENISKQYRLGQVGTGTLSHDLNRWWHKVRGKEDPYLKIGEVNDRTKKGDSQYVWSLKDINFEIEQGSAVGIIGRNGAGKSTLLKLLSKVTLPTTGSFKLNGRIASLLEVGTGFHPEMTGRENIYLNGAILGMTRSEIKRKFDEIVSFAGIEKYVDTPVKRYSSGMYVRLAFSVAAHLESEILIVDEVLAVGDAEFQKKCLGKMNDVTKGEGRTVLFVSHNMGSIRNLCTSGIFLERGTIKKIGGVEECIQEYMDISTHSNESYVNLQNFPDRVGKRDNIELKSINILNLETNTPSIILNSFGKVAIEFEYQVKREIPEVELGFVFQALTGEVINYYVSSWESNNLKKEIGTHKIRCIIDHLNLTPSPYSLSAWVKIKTAGVDDQVNNCMSITVEDVGLYKPTANFEIYPHIKSFNPSLWENI